MKLKRPLNQLLRSKRSLRAALGVLAVMALFGTSASNAFTNAPPVTSPSQSTGSPPSSGGSTAQPPTYIMPNAGGNAAESGRSNQLMQYAAAGANIAAAVMYAKICAAAWGTPPECAWSGVAMGAAGVLGLLGQGSGSAGGDVSALDPSLYPPGYNPPPGTGGDGGPGTGIGGPGDGSGGPGDIGVAGQTPGGLPAGLSRDYATAKKLLGEKGIKVGPDGSVTFPDGRSFGANNPINSESAALAAGFTRDEWAKGMANSNAIKGKLAKKFEQMKQLAAAGAGGGRGIASEGGGGESGYDGFDPFGRNANAHKRKKASVSGLTKKLGSDTIGVSGDNIFEMVSRRYKARDANSEFLKN